MSIWGSVVPIVGGLIDNAIENSNIRSNNEADRQFQERMNAEQYQRSIDMWNRTNEYNSPSNEVKRMRLAGLNPAMMYKGGYSAAPAQMAASIPAPNYHPMRSQSPGSAIERSLLLSNSLRLGDAQADNLTAQTAEHIGNVAVQSYQKGLIEAQTGNVKADTTLKAEQEREARSRTRLHGKEWDKLDWDITRSSTLLPYDIQSASAKANLDYEERKYLIGKAGREALLTSSNLQEAVARISEIAQRMSHSRTEQDEIRARTADLLRSNRYASVPNDHSDEFDRMVGNIMNGIITGVSIGIGSKAARKIGGKFVSPSHRVNEYTNGNTSTTYFR